MLHHILSSPLFGLSGTVPNLRPQQTRPVILVQFPSAATEVGIKPTRYQVPGDFESFGYYLLQQHAGYDVALDLGGAVPYVLTLNRIWLGFLQVCSCHMYLLLNRFVLFGLHPKKKPSQICSLHDNFVADYDGHRGENTEAHKFAHYIQIPSDDIISNDHDSSLVQYI